MYTHQLKTLKKLSKIHYRQVLVTVCLSLRSYNNVRRTNFISLQKSKPKPTVMNILLYSAICETEVQSFNLKCRTREITLLKLKNYDRHLAPSQVSPNVVLNLSWFCNFNNVFLCVLFLWLGGLTSVLTPSGRATGIRAGVVGTHIRRDRYTRQRF